MTGSNIAKAVVNSNNACICFPHILLKAEVLGTSLLLSLLAAANSPSSCEPSTSASPVTLVSPVSASMHIKQAVLCLTAAHNACPSTIFKPQ
jgi:hypothetical protein